MNGFKTIYDYNINKISLYGKIQHDNQLFFNKDWTANCNSYRFSQMLQNPETGQWTYIETNTEDTGDDYYQSIEERYLPNKFSDFYSSNYFNWFNDWKFFTYNKRRTYYIQDIDQYKIHILNYNNYISGYFIPLQNLNIEYINSTINSFKATANNKYFYYQDLSIDQPYLLDKIISNTQGQLSYSYMWNPNGINISFDNNAPTGETCHLIFKRIYTQINRQSLYGMYNPKIYIRNKSDLSKTLNYITMFEQNKVIINFYEETSGMTEGFDCNFIDFNQMYKLNIQTIDNYTATLDINCQFKKSDIIQQYLGVKVLVWQQQDNNQWKIIRSYENMLKDNFTLSYPQMISGRKYRADIYAILRRHVGSLSGIYSDDRTYYLQRSWYENWYDYKQCLYYDIYKNKPFIEDTVNIGSVEGTINGNYGLISGVFSIPYGQFAGTIYTADNKALYNDNNGKAILKHQSEDIEYECAWTGYQIYSIDYIYPGNYYFEVTYGNLVIYTQFILFSLNNIQETTTKIFNTNILFKALKYNIYNEQTNKLALTCQPSGQNITYKFHGFDDYYHYYYNNFNYKLKVYTKEDLSQENIINNLTKNIFQINTHIIDDITITDQAQINSMYLFELNASENLSIPISKLISNSNQINSIIDNNKVAFYISDPSISSNATIQIWTPYWYWNKFYITFSTYEKYVFYFYFKGLSASLYDQNNNFIPMEEYYYAPGINYTLNTINDINEICRDSYRSGNRNYSGLTQQSFSRQNEQNYLKTGKYKIKYTKEFINKENSAICFGEKEIDIYDNNYYYDTVPDFFPHKQIYIRPLFKQNRTLSGNFAGQFNITNYYNSTISNYINYSSINLSTEIIPNNSTIYNSIIYKKNSDTDIISGYINYNSNIINGYIEHKLNNKILSGEISGNIELSNTYNNNYNVNYNISSIISGIIDNNEVGYLLQSSISGKLISGYYMNIEDNTLLSIPVFCGNAPNIIDYELSEYHGIYHNITNYPPWTNWFNCECDRTDAINIIDQLNFWFSIFDIYNSGDASNPLNIIGLYQLSSIYSNSNFIDDISINNTSIGYITQCSNYTGINVSGKIFDYNKEYILLVGQIDKISIGGYITDSNNQEWNGLSFDVNIYKQNESTPYKQLFGLNRNRFDIGLIDKGIYRIEMFIAGTTKNILHPDDEIKQWYTNSTQSVLFRTYFAKCSSLIVYSKFQNKYTDVYGNQIALQLQLLPSATPNTLPFIIDNQNNQYTRFYEYYTKNGYYYYSTGQLLAGFYNIKYKWNLVNITLNKSELTFIDNTSSFIISQTKLKSFIPSTYQQPIDGNVCLGTLLDANNKIIYYKQVIVDNNLSCQIISNDIELPDSFDTCICQQAEIYENIALTSTSHTINCIFNSMWSKNTVSVCCNNVPSNNNNKIICKSIDNYIEYIYNTTSFENSNYWIKYGTQFYAQAYHDNLLIGESDIKTYTTNLYISFNINYPISEVSTYFIDAITNSTLSMTYYNSDNNFMHSYHLECEDNTNLTSSEIINKNILYNEFSNLNSSPAITNNLYQNQNYLIHYHLGYNSQFDIIVSAYNLPATGLINTIILPYGSISCYNRFIDRNNNTNSINPEYVTLILSRKQGDNYDIDYTYDGTYRTVYIKTGYYKIKLISHIPNQQSITMEYERPNLLANNLTLTNYINTNPATIICKLQNNNGSTYTNNDLKIITYHNNLIYSVSEYSSIEQGKISLSLFNIPFIIAIVDSTQENIIPISNVAIESSFGTTYQINNNKIQFATTNKTETFYITLA